MTKYFCDLCGELAAENQQPGAVLEDETKAWSGYKTNAAGGGCDGRWVPKVFVRAVFTQADFKDMARDKIPDLCRACQIKLVERLLEKLKPETNHVTTNT